MAQIRRIDLLLTTGDVEGAGTDGDVYLGVAGREFFVDSDANDFERASRRVYRFGDRAEFTNDTMLNKVFNDPRRQRLFTEFIDDYPLYIRFVPQNRTDNWNLQLAVVALNSDESVLWHNLNSAPNGIWLGTRAGLVLHLPKFEEPRVTVADRARITKAVRAALR
jgi:hypothetical protein